MNESFFKNEEEHSQTPAQDIPELESDTKTSQNTADEELSENFQTEEGRMAAIMSYIPILCFVPLLNMRENKEARFHARQGVLLFLVELIAVIFLIDGISDFVFKAVLILSVALAAFGIYFALQGKNYKLPIIGDLVKKSKM